MSSFLFGEEADAIFRSLQGVSNARYALCFTASFPNIALVLSGMSDMAQMQDNLHAMKDFQPLDEKEQDAIRRVCDIFQ